MDYEIYPLSITQVEWKLFIDLCKEFLGYSPTRGLDTCRIDPKDPAAYLGCLDLENEPLKALRSPNRAWEHFHISFLAAIDDTVIIQLAETELKILHKLVRGHKYIVLLTGSVAEWYRAVKDNTKKTAPYEIRWLMCQVVARLEQTHFREIFSDSKKIKLGDGTFTI